MISRKTVMRLLFGIVVSLTSLSFAGQYSKYFLGHGRLGGFIQLFDVNAEENITNWYQSVSLFAVSVLLWAVFRCTRVRKDPSAAGWKVLAFILLAMSIDEVATIHEVLTHLLAQQLHIINMYAAWTILGVTFLLAAGLYFRRFLTRLPTSVRNRVMFAWAIYVYGAIGSEIINGYIAVTAGEENILYEISSHLGELAEMAGILILIDSLLLYLEKFLEQSRFEVDLGA